MSLDDGISAIRLRGSLNYLQGLSAEDSAVHHYETHGFHVEARRWRGRAGEVDIILSDGDIHVFVEVKKASTFDLAATRLTTAQLSRVASAAEEYMGERAGDPRGFFRIDAALVDETGRVEVIENVTLA